MFKSVNSMKKIKSKILENREFENRVESILKKFQQFHHYQVSNAQTELIF